MRILRPWRFVEKVTDIDPGELRSMGIKLMIFDFDNTLAFHRSEKIDPSITGYLMSLKDEGMLVYILSNAKKNRIEKLLDDLSLKGRGMALKPFPLILKSVMKAHKASKNDTILVGDQLFTDILAGNLAGVRTILVSRLSDSEAAAIRFRRKLETYILKRSKYLD